MNLTILDRQISWTIASKKKVVCSLQNRKLTILCKRQWHRVMQQKKESNYFLQTWRKIRFPYKIVFRDTLMEEADSGEQKKRWKLFSSELKTSSYFVQWHLATQQKKRAGERCVATICGRLSLVWLREIF